MTEELMAITFVMPLFNANSPMLSASVTLKGGSQHIITNK